MDVLVLYLGITVIGYFTGAFLKKRGIVLKRAGIIQTVAIIILVFVMGSRIGADKEIVRSLDAIGSIALIMTLLILAGSVGAVFLMRKALGFDGRGDLRGSGAAVLPEVIVEEGSDAKADHTMIACIFVPVTLGILAGYFFLPQWFIDHSGTVITIGLSVLLLLVGVDLGTEGTIVTRFRQAGWRIIVFPFCIIIGTYVGAAVSALFLPISVKDALCAASGFGWYTLAPAMLAEYSTEVSAIAFMHNVMRELFGILLLPFVAKRVGHIECVGLPGAGAMDMCLPIIVKATSSNIAVYSFIAGVVLSIAVPIMVSFMMGI